MFWKAKSTKIPSKILTDVKNTPRSVDFTSIFEFFELISPAGYIAATLQ